MRVLWHVIVVSLLCLSAGCGSGKLSKEKARDVLLKQYARDSSAYCAIEVRSERTGSPQLFRLMDMPQATAQEACIGALASLGGAKGKRCMDDRPVCDDWLFEPGDKVSVSGSGTFRRVLVTCGENKLGDVVSVATEGKIAEVTYRQSTGIDDKTAKALSACRVAVPPSGLQERKVTLKCDDEGNWTATSN